MAQIKSTPCVQSFILEGQREQPVRIMWIDRKSATKPDCRADSRNDVISKLSCSFVLCCIKRFHLNLSGPTERCILQTLLVLIAQ